MDEATRKTSWLRRRRAERLRREITMLENMDARLWRKTVICGILAIAALAAVFFGIGFAMHVNLGLTGAIASSIGLAALLYWISRYEGGLFWLSAAILITIIFAAIFEGWPSHDIPAVDGLEGLNRKPDHKAERRRKINLAIMRRKLRLEAMLRGNLN